MGNIIQMNAQQMQSALQSANQLVSGMSYQEAAAALGGGSQKAGPTVIHTFPLLNKTGGAPVSLEAQYATQTWNYYKTAFEAAGITSLGAAASAGYQWAQGVIMGTGEGLAATGGVLTLSAPTAVAAAAPLLGVGIGVALYESNPELWTKISDKVVGIFGNAITAIMDATGKIFLPKSFVDSLDEVFKEEGIGGDADTGYATSDLTTGLKQPIAIGDELRYMSGSIYEWHKVATTAWWGGPNYIYASATRAVKNYMVNITTGKITQQADSNLTSYYDYGEKRVWFDRSSSGSAPKFPTEKNEVEGTIVPGAIAWTIVYGNISRGGFPEGTEQWRGITPATIPQVPVYNPESQSTDPYYPVQLPLGDVPPGTSPDPEVQPDPTAPTPPELIPYIDPYISPVIDPAIQWPEELPLPTPDELTGPGADEDPTYVPEPDLNPDDDPTKRKEDDPDEDPDDKLPYLPYVPTNREPPEWEGHSPEISFPKPDIPFPTWTPSGSETPVVSGEPGFIQVYNPTGGEFITFGRWLWVTYADADMDKIWNNPFDGVIGAHELYATPSKDGYSTIRCGFLDSGVGSIVVNQRYTTINCGSMVIPEYWGNYLDYSPYSQALVYLPFIGIVNLDVDDIVGSAINIVYHVDSYTGACIAQITAARDNYENTLYQFSGNCAVEIPMAGGSQAAIKAAMMTADAYQNAANISAIMSGIGGIGSGLATAIGGLFSLTPGGIAGGIASGIGQAVNGLTNAASQYAQGQAQHTANMLSGKSVVQHSGTFGANYGAMGIKKPYIIIRRPIQKVVTGYNKLYGYPAHKQVVIGACTGFLRCREVHVVSSLATDAEKALIEQLLVTGVYVTEEET